MVDANLKQTIFDSVSNVILILIVTPLAKHFYPHQYAILIFKRGGSLGINPRPPSYSWSVLSITVKNNGTQTNDENSIKPP